MYDVDVRRGQIYRKICPHCLGHAGGRQAAVAGESQYPGGELKRNRMSFCPRKCKDEIDNHLDETENSPNQTGTKSR